MKCVQCQGSDWLTFYKSNLSFSVCSDCRPLNFAIEVNQCECCGHLQKRMSNSYHQRVKELYNTYQAYQLNQGSEHLTFTGEVPFTRSNQILKNCEQYFNSVHSVLDIGCGSGSMLKALNIFDHNLVLSGHDVSEHLQEKIQSIKGVENFYSGDLDNINNKFDVIILSHVLEHIDDINEFFNKIKNLLSLNSIVLIQVPNFIENPLDFFVYDHISHFTKKSLHTLLEQHFNHVQLSSKLIARELTFIVSMQPLSKIEKNVCADESSKIYENLNFIENMENTLMTINEPVYVFSTGPGGTLLGNFLGNNLAGFIDEDMTQEGKLHLSKPIFSPKSVPNESIKIILPFLPDFNEKIKQRLNFLNFIN